MKGRKTEHTGELVLLSNATTGETVPPLFSAMEKKQPANTKRFFSLRVDPPATKGWLDLQWPNFNHSSSVTLAKDSPGCQESSRKVGEWSWPLASIIRHLFIQTHFLGFWSSLKAVRTTFFWMLPISLFDEVRRWGRRNVRQLGKKLETLHKQRGLFYFT